MQTVPRLPGIVFEPEPRQLDMALPRMDIPAFVGFAAAGPLHTPVAIEDLGRFRELFGLDLPLAWDAQRSQMETAWLGLTVEAFFRNGGQRCWVVRVAGADAYVHRFPLSGLVPVETEGVGAERQPVCARARSAGSWADTLRVDTILVWEHLPLDGINVAAGDYTVDVRSTATAVTTLRRGDLLEIFLTPEQPLLFLFIDDVTSKERGSRLSGRNGYWYVCGSGSPPHPANPTHLIWIGLDEEQAIDQFETWRSAGSPEPRPSVRLLRFEIRASNNDTSEIRLGDLAFSSQHPRFWANLPADEELFQLSQGRESLTPNPESAAFFAEASLPRFPLAGPDKQDRAERYLPLGMRPLPDPLSAQGPLADMSGAALTRDGLEHFKAELFLDPDLVWTGLAALRGEAEYKYYIRGQALRGIHSLLPLDEVTLLGVPDAVHRTWDRHAAPAENLLAAPSLDPISPEPDLQADPLGRYQLSWSKVSGATAYLVQQANSPEFDDPTSHFVESRGETFRLQLSAEPETQIRLGLPEDCSRTWYFRVRALRYAIVSPWSETRGRLLPATDFNACHTSSLVELRLDALPIGSPAQATLLTWSAVSDKSIESSLAAEYVLQEAADADFIAPHLRQRGSETSATVSGLGDAPAYYRVRICAGDCVGPWSNTVRVQPISRSVQTLIPESSYDDTDLLAIQRAVMRFCAARGDLLACLSLPRHYRRQEVLEHLAALSPWQNATEPPQNAAEFSVVRASVPPLTAGEAGALSYAAVYHPWLAARPDSRSDVGTQSSRVFYMPPDGAIVGHMARRALEHGAWIAPANQSLTGILAVDPDFGREEWCSLTAAQVNIVGRDPRGFLVLNAETLSQDNDLRLINIRRLLILLRRLALREGKAYVFEPHDADFRRFVRHRFERLLSDLYVRGAFAGTRPQDAYRVVADESVNPPEAADLGRFIVELRVAPSRPLVFQRIRLVQAGPEQLLVQER